MSNQEIQYDVVIVGGGISGAIIAKELGSKGKKVLIIDAGQPYNETTYQEYQDEFYNSPFKDPGAPYPFSENAPAPSVIELARITDLQKQEDNPVSEPGWTNIQRYWIQKGPLPFSSTYERKVGGTTLHWLGTCLRMVPNDFQAKTVYGNNDPDFPLPDWPLTYDQLQQFYEKAEWEIGVSADKDEQGYLDIQFNKAYNYPMPKIPQSYSDQVFSKQLEANGPFTLKGISGFDSIELSVNSTPQGRNSIPNDQRPSCAGNTSCVPICPIKAKYNAGVTIGKALDTSNVEIWHQTVAYQVMVDENNKEITGIAYKQYETKGGPCTKSGIVQGKLYVLAAHAMENAKLLLISGPNQEDLINGRYPGVANSSGQVGRNFMDHPVYLHWGLNTEKIYQFRGPLSTSGIENLRDGSFRKERSAFRIEIGNAGWNYPTGSPYPEFFNLVDNGVDLEGNQSSKPLFGTQLKQIVNEQFTRQFRIGFLVEQTPDQGNRITPDWNLKDNLGIPRPVVNYDLSEYTKLGFKAAKATAQQIFKQLGTKDLADEFLVQQKYEVPGLFQFENELYNYAGAGHLVGTHRMGDDASNSVVNKKQQSWDHPNLFVVGCGVFPTIATSNPTLTMAALAFQASENILAELG